MIYASIQLTGETEVRVNANHFKPAGEIRQEFFSVAINTESGRTELLLTREQMDLICVRMGQALMDSDPKAEALMERDHTRPDDLGKCIDPVCHGRCGEPFDASSAEEVSLDMDEIEQQAQSRR